VNGEGEKAFVCEGKILDVGEFALSEKNVGSNPLILKQLAKCKNPFVYSLAKCKNVIGARLKICTSSKERN
jgi:hypothetical protein